MWHNTPLGITSESALRSVIWILTGVLACAPQVLTDCSDPLTELVAGPDVAPLNTSGSVVSVAVNEQHIVVANSDGAIFESPDLGAPANIAGVTNAFLGIDFGLALTSNGSVVGWGTRSGGVVSGGVVSGGVVPGDLAPATNLAVGPTHALALHGDGSVTAWGDNAQKQLLIPEFVKAGTTVAIAVRYWSAMGHVVSCTFASSLPVDSVVIAGR